MAKTRVTEAQIKKILKEVADGAKPPVLAKKYNFSLGTYYNWKNKYGLPKGKGGAASSKRGRPAKAKAATKKKAAPKKAAAKRGRPAKAKAKAAPKKATARRGRPAKAKAATKKAATRKTTARRGRPAAAASSSASKVAKVVATYSARLDKLNKAYAAALAKAAK